MLGLFGTLDLAARSLATQQEATAVAGQNMANVNNPAYARETLVVQTAPALETPIGEEGTGADGVSIAEARDALLDNQVQAENSVTGSYGAQQSALQSAEAYLGEQLDSTSGTAAESPNGLAADLSNLFDSFQSLSASPTDPSVKGSVVNSAQELTAQFNTVSGNLSQVRAGLNTSIQNDVASSNQDLTDIATLNQQIAQAEGGGATANQLVDERQQKIEDLAGYVNISPTTEANGSVDISIGGVAMVTGGSAVNSLQTYDAGGGQLLIQDAASAAPLAVSGGSISGNITARDGGLASLQSSLDTLASQLITNVNAIYSGGGANPDFFTGTDAATIAVNPALTADPAQVQAGTGAAGDNSIALGLAMLAGQNISGLNNQTFTGSYAQTVSALGDAISTATDQSNTSQAVSTMLNNQRSSVSGVSVDQEMTDLMQFQKAYEVSAQLITTVNTMMETVISMKTV